MYRNLPNFLTIIRLLLAPFVGLELWAGNYRTALELLLLAGLSDGADGFLARRFAWTSHLGAYLDPVADKLLLVTVYVILGRLAAIPVWFVCLVLGRDVFILSMAAAAFAFTTVRKFPPSVWGKISTLTQVAAALFVITRRAFAPGGYGGFERSLVMLTAAATIWSGAHYGWRGATMLRLELAHARRAR